MADADALVAEIDRLVDGGGDADELARTLTDGYALALRLEGERTRLRKRIAELAASIALEPEPAAVEELKALAARGEQQDAEIAALRRKLDRLRARHSLAVRSHAP